MRVIKGLLDRIIFAAGVLLFMQMPHVIDLYEQRLGGYYQAQVEYLQQYQKIAEQQHQGNIIALINEFKASSKRSVQQTAANIQSTYKQTNELKRDMQVLETGSFVSKLFHLSTRLKLDIAQATIQSLKPAFPLTLEAFICGMLGGISLSFIFNMFLSFPKLFISRDRKSKQQPDAKVKRRIEPTVMRTARTA